METIEQNKVETIEQNKTSITYPPEMELWGADQVSEYLGYTRQYFMQHIAKQPKFPAMRNCSTRKYPKWLKNDILKWATEK